MKPTRKLFTFLLGSSLLAAAATTYAQTWTGGGADANWTTDGNWTGGTPSTSGTGTSTVTFYDTGATQLTNSTGGLYNLNQIAFNSGAASPVTINVTASPNTFDSGTAIRFNAGTNISVAAGDHKIVGTGVNSGASYDVIFNGAANSTHTFDIATGASFDINGRISRGSVTDNKTYAKTGGGTLILSGFNGGSSAWAINASKAFEIQAGALRFAQANASGNSQNNYTVSSDAAFEIDGVSLQLNNGNVTLNGTGISSGGALRSISGDSILQGNNTTGTIVLATSSSIGVDAGTLTIKKVISGSGDLTKVGAGTLVLDGTLQGTGGAFDHTYTGATTISAGTLEIRGSIASSSGITNNAALVFNSASAQSYGNVISGTGALTKQGAGTLTITGNNTYTGDTTISAGVLQVGDGGTTGRLGGDGSSTASNTSIATGAELRINRSGTGYDYHGVLSGSGTVNIISGSRMNFRTVANQTSSGDLSFVVNGTLGINTSSGVKEVHLGELSGSGVIQRSGTAPGSPTPPYTLLIGAKDTSSTYTGTLGSFAELTVEKVGTGTLTLDSSFSHGSGTTVSAGTLLVNGSLASSGSAVTVGLNGTLGGTGTIAGATTVAGNLSPGNSPGVLSFSSSLALEASSTTTMEIATTGMVRGTDYDGVNVGTTLTLDGDLVLDLDSIFSDGTYVFDLFAVTGSTSGDFDSVALTGTYGDHSLSLDSGLWTTTTNSGNETWSFSQTTGDLTLTVIPEPGTALLGGLGFLLLLRRRR